MTMTRQQNFLTRNGKCIQISEMNGLESSEPGKHSSVPQLTEPFNRLSTQTPVASALVLRQ